MQFLIRLLCHLAPSLMIRMAYNKLTNPQVYKLRSNEIKVLNKSEKSFFKFLDFNIQTYHWKGVGPSILLIHGWEGQAGNFSDIIESLRDNGFNVFAFDGPSHGFSSKGKTSLFEFNNLVLELIKYFDVQYLISHSFGGVATTFALTQLPDLSILKYVLFTTPDKFSERIDDVCQKAGVTEKVKLKLIELIEDEIGQSVSNLNVSGFVKSINVDEALIIHDKDDKVIPLTQSRNVHLNWPNSHFEVVENTGHFKILRTKETIQLAMQFLLND